MISKQIFLLQPSKCNERCMVVFWTNYNIFDDKFVNKFKDNSKDE